MTERMPELGDYLQVLLAHRRMLVLGTVLAGAGSLAVSFLQPDVYEVEALLLVGQVAQLHEGRIESRPLADAQTVAATLGDRFFRQTVLTKGGLSAAAIKELEVTVEALRESRLVRLVVQTAGAERAMQVTQVLVDALTEAHRLRFEEWRRANERVATDALERMRSLEKSIAVLREAVEARRPPIGETGPGQLLYLRLKDLETVREELRAQRELAAVAGGALHAENTSLVTPLLIPDRPVGPRRVTNTALGTLAGFAVVAGLALFREYWRRFQTAR